jgi:hypothetical protein
MSGRFPCHARLLGDMATPDIWRPTCSHIHFETARSHRIEANAHEFRRGYLPGCEIQEADEGARNAYLLG